MTKPALTRRQIIAAAAALPAVASIPAPAVASSEMSVTAHTSRGLTVGTLKGLIEHARQPGVEVFAVYKGGLNFDFSHTNPLSVPMPNFPHLGVVHGEKIWP